MNNLFYLDDIEIEEPVGFEDIELSIKRDDTFHGMSYEASTSSLQFYGIASIYLKELKESLGVKANVTFKALMACENYDYEIIIHGRLNFGKYKESCGSECMVSMPIEQESCAIIFNARKSQRVDVNKELGVDGATPLQPYDGINVLIELPAHNLKAGIDASVADEGYSVPQVETGLFNEVLFAFRPLYFVKRLDSLATGNIDSGVDSASEAPVGGLSDVISPQLLFEDTINCFDGNFDYVARLKGVITIDVFDGSGFTEFLRVRLAKGEWPGSLTDIDVSVLTDLNTTPFDVTFTGTTTLANGEGLYMLIEIEKQGTPNMNMFIDVAFDKESMISIIANKSCPASDVELSYIHETLSRVTESITNGCIRVKSSFYGRTDSEPFAFPSDGCGGLRTLTSGLKIRKAVEDNFFASPEELIKGLNAIDNIGFDIVQDPNILSKSLLRVEDVDFFYQDIEILRHDAIPKGITEVEESKIYAKIDAGYKKWEVEDVNGLNEFNSGRQYNTSIDTVNTSLDIASNLVTGTIPIEITRQQSFANSGGADTKYDNETFLICMRRTSYPYGSIEVELDNIDNPLNIYSPSTIKNYRISPIRNLMRWYKTIVSGFNSLVDTANQLFFSSGSGNLIASGKMTDSTCREENTEMAENQNIFVTQFKAEFTPIWKPELLTYNYPMSIKDYNSVKANPYGYISAQCGEDFLKYWIKEIKYKPMKGVATIIGRRKYVN